MNAAEIRLALEKLNVLGRVLYVAAHPDDENTGLISFWANGTLYESAYLSVTRGDGGQNLIGPELREQLGVIRTQELLAARRTDHGRQFFTRANDFGYSKSVGETLRIWDRGKILADVVWVIRQFRPDVIVTRFSLEDDFTHGHHTASAQLAQEAFRAAADPQRFPEQLKFVEPWQAARLLWNTSQFFFRARNQPFDSTGLISIEAGAYQPLLGKSYGEIAAASRTMHKSQGFGVSIERDAQKEYFKLLDGSPAEEGNLFSGIDTTWSRVRKAAGIEEKICAIIGNYDMASPAASVPALVELRKSLSENGKDFWMREKLTQTDNIIAACLGLHFEAVTEREAAQPGDTLNVQIEAINRSDVPVQFSSVRVASGEVTSVNAALPALELLTRKFPLKLSENIPFSQPYWLREPGSLGTFAVGDQTLIGRAESLPAFPVEVTVQVADQEITYNLEPRFRKLDRVEGEVSRSLVIAPAAFVDLPRPVFVFGNQEPKRLDVRVIASAENVKTTVALEAPAGWKIEPASAPVDLHGSESETTCTFHITPPAAEGEGTLRAVLSASGGETRMAYSRQRIEYPHIELQTLISPTQARIVRAKIENKAKRIGYLPGAGDAIPESLHEIGSDVKILADGEVKAENLASFDAIVVGVRAANVHPARVATWFPELLAYARNGGVVIYQYNTIPGPQPEHLPYPLKIGRDRVTDEKAEIRIL
ncbi:MAG: PIG-L family deacetylase, partial [Chthoniobacterales bacterium]|nr:PIG-L family deacetylase [Chthoniobacterales bacterium]